MKPPLEVLASDEAVGDRLGMPGVQQRLAMSLATLTAHGWAEVGAAHERLALLACDALGMRPRRIMTGYSPGFAGRRATYTYHLILPAFAADAVDRAYAARPRRSQDEACLAEIRAWASSPEAILGERDGFGDGSGDGFGGGGSEWTGEFA